MLGEENYREKYGDVTPTLQILLPCRFKTKQFF